MSNITVYKSVKKISTKLQVVAEKTAKTLGATFLLHTVYNGHKLVAVISCISSSSSYSTLHLAIKLTLLIIVSTK